MTKSTEQFRRKVTLPDGNCMAYERQGQHFIGDKHGIRLRRLTIGKTKAHLIANQPDKSFADEVKRMLDVAEQTGDTRLHLSRA